MPIRVEGLTHVYSLGTSLEVTALRDVSLEIGDGEFVGIIGPTGSGKTTLVQHFNGLLRPTAGRIWVDDLELTRPRAPLREVRKTVGLVFQYPEHQLFEETVAEDVAFGPKNLGLDAAEVKERVAEALRLVGLGPELGARSPFELSGGQMRRVAIAGVLAMRPRVLILDEPAAGLDPGGRDEILGHVRDLHGQLDLTVILVSHNMEDIARLVQRVVVMKQGRVRDDGPVRRIFSDMDLLRELGIDPPPIVALMQALRARGRPVRSDILTVSEARDEILRLARSSD